MEKQTVVVADLGVMAYADAWTLQEELVAKNVAIKKAVNTTQLTVAGNDAASGCSTTNHQLQTTNHLFLVEHPPVYTLGKSGKMEHVLLSEEERNQQGIQFYQTNRGGDITFHGPGQLVVYPIIDLENFYTDIGRYLRELEEVVIQTIAEFGITGGRSKGETGVWIDACVAGAERKICAMGVRCSRWVTMHGLALNVNTDLTYFNGIVPCGIANKQVTSMQKELGKPVAMQEVKDCLLKKFAGVFNVHYAKVNRVAYNG